jgi:hypothetical protein
MLELYTTLIDKSIKGSRSPQILVTTLYILICIDTIGCLHIGSLVLLLSGGVLLLSSSQTVTGLISFTLAVMVVYSFTERRKYDEMSLPT